MEWAVASEGSPGYESIFIILQRRHVPQSIRHWAPYLGADFTAGAFWIASYAETMADVAGSLYFPRPAEGSLSSCDSIKALNIAS